MLYVVFLLHNMLCVFRSKHHCSWKFHKFHRKTPVLESLLKSYRPADLFHVGFSLYPIIHVNYVKSYCLFKHFYGFSEIGLWKCWRKKNFHFTTNISIYIYGSQTFWSVMKFYFVHLMKVSFFVFKKQSLSWHSSVYA